MMYLFGVGVDEDIVQIDDDEYIGHVLEDVVHEVLKRGGSVSESHRHDKELERSITGPKCGFPLLAGRNSDVVVTCS